MKFTVNRQVLSEAVSNLSHAVASKTTIPVLEGILMETTEQGLKMQAYNFEMGMEKNIKIKCEEKGSVVINAKILVEMLRKMSGDDVTITVDNKLMCKIESLSAVYDIIGMNPSDFPEIFKVEDSVKFVLPTEMIKKMVRQTVFASATEENSRPVLTGIFFEIDKETIKLIAVDGFRLAIRKENFVSNNNISFIASAKTISEVVKIIKEENEDILINVSNKHILINIDGYSIVSRLLEGNYIDYNNFIPKSYSTTIRVNTREIISIIERISILINANETIKSPIRCSIKNKKIVFTSRTPLGSAVDSCDAIIVGEEIDIGFNSKYLLDALKATESDEVVFQFNGPLSPIIITPVRNDSFIYMVMPMRLKDEI